MSERSYTSSAVSYSAPYEEFLAAKVELEFSCGFQVPPSALSPVLKPHQADIVRWALAGGRRALFESFGLGKTVQELEILRLIQEREGGRSLIVCPLGVRGEFIRDARVLLDMEPPRFVRWSHDVDGDGVYITNYQSIRDGRLDPSMFNAVCLDEAAVLRSYGSLTYQRFLSLFESVQYRFVATATPAPNRYKELIHYAGMLGVMDTGAALTRFFQRDSEHANNLTLYPHKEREFYLWLNTWAIFLRSPADLGYDATGYDLPELSIHWHEVQADTVAHRTATRGGQGLLLPDVTLGVVGAARQKRATLADRVKVLMNLIEGFLVGVADPSMDQVVIWCDLNDEQRAIEKALGEAGLTYSSIYGSLDIDETERRIQCWRDHQTYALVGKPVMLGQGLNLQQANKCVYVGVTFKFADLIQSIHRIQRYGQTRPCEAHLIHADSEMSVVRTLKDKWAHHEELTKTMGDVVTEYGLDAAAVAEALRRSIGVERVEASGPGWTMVCNDTVPETASMATDSVDLIVTSIPFANHYEYTPAVEDFGHTKDNDHFWKQMDFLTPQLLRVLRPGRMYCCHVKDRILFGNVTGAGVPTVSPFHAEALMHARGHGFDFMGMITVVTDVVRENNQSYRLGWTENSKDGTKMGVGSPEYILLFRKPQSDRSRGYADVPVVKDKECYTRARWQIDAHAFWRCAGNRLLAPEDLEGLRAGERQALFTEWSRSSLYDYDCHIRIGESLDTVGKLSATHMSLAPASECPEVWADINRMRTLNSEQSRRAQVNHICPIQLELVDRLVERYSNPGDLVYDPFGGLGTVPRQALLAGRRGRAVELNPGYWADAVAYLKAAEHGVRSPTLFDLIEVEVA